MSFKLSHVSLFVKYFLGKKKYTLKADLEALGFSFESQGKILATSIGNNKLKIVNSRNPVNLA